MEREKKLVFVWQMLKTKTHIRIQIHTPKPEPLPPKKNTTTHTQICMNFHPKVKFTKTYWFIGCEEGKSAISKHYHPEKNYYQDHRVALCKNN